MRRFKRKARTEKVLSLAAIDAAVARCQMQDDSSCPLVGELYCDKRCPIRRDFERESGEKVQAALKEADHAQ